MTAFEILYPQQPEAFRLFSRLPAEIRLIIWAFTIKPRFIYLGTTIVSARTDTVSSQPVPKILHINSESRAFGLNIYDAYKSNLSKSKYVQMRSKLLPRHYYFNSSIDLFGMHELEFEMAFADLRKCPMRCNPKHLFLNASLPRLWEWIDDLQIQNSEQLWYMNFARLESVTLIPAAQRSNRIGRHLNGDRPVGYRQAYAHEIIIEDDVVRWNQTFGSDNPQISKSYSGLGKVKLRFIMPVYHDEQDQMLLYQMDP